MNKLVKNAQTFVQQVYIPDVLAIAGFYKDWFKYGAGIGNYMAYGDYTTGSQKDPAGFMFPRGIILGRDLSTVHPVDPTHISEYVTHSWYNYAEGDGVGIHPSKGETNPEYSGPKPPFDFLKTDEKYSWVKSPRYDDTAMEVGPLARTLIAYASGKEEVKKIVDGVLTKLDVPATALYSTLGRIAARAIEADIMVGEIGGWIAQLDDNMAHGNLTMHNGKQWNPNNWPQSCQGFGFHEAPRGSLGHWIEIEDKKIANYQAVVPSTWNAGPRDAKGQRGAYEAALAGTPIADPERPLEVLRTVHSFDPCLACAVHVVQANGTLYGRRPPSGLPSL
jgi:Ni,Fe-hydrogenase I large subunit